MEFFEELRIKLRWFLMHGNHRILCVLLFFIERNKRYPKFVQASLWVWVVPQLRACFKDGFRHESHFYCGGTKCTGRWAEMCWVIILKWNNPCHNLVYGSQIILGDLISLSDTRGHFHRIMALIDFSDEVIINEDGMIWLKSSCKLFYWICWQEGCYLARI